MMEASGKVPVAYLIDGRSPLPTGEQNVVPRNHLTRVRWDNTTTVGKNCDLRGYSLTYELGFPFLCLQYPNLN
jgi:hypothetical protein